MAGGALIPRLTDFPRNNAVSVPLRILVLARAYVATPVASGRRTPGHSGGPPAGRPTRPRPTSPRPVNSEISRSRPDASHARSPAFPQGDDRPPPGVAVQLGPVPPDRLDRPRRPRPRQRRDGVGGGDHEDADDLGRPGPRACRAAVRP